MFCKTFESNGSTKMDRIKQALDRARAERTVAAAEHVLQDRSPRKPRDELNGSPITYSQTRTATVDPALLRANRVIFGDADRAGLAAYKMLRTQVMQRMAAKGWNALAITSPTEQDGKTLTAVNLAISLARELHKTVLLVDTDLRNPSVSKYFGVEPNKGISDHLLRGEPLSNVLVNPGIERLVILPGREHVANSSELLASPAMGTMVGELKSRYPSRLVIFDLPPILLADDALAFSPYVDAFVLVVRDGKTRKSMVEQAVELMGGISILGTVLNDVTETVPGYY